MDHLNNTMKTICDFLALFVSLAAWLTTIMPALASIVTFAWGCIRIYEWWKGRKNGNVKLD